MVTRKAIYRLYFSRYFFSSNCPVSSGDRYFCPLTQMKYLLKDFCQSLIDSNVCQCTIKNKFHEIPCTIFWVELGTKLLSLAYRQTDRQTNVFKKAIKLCSKHPKMSKSNKNHWWKTFTKLIFFFIYMEEIIIINILFVYVIKMLHTRVK